jgi:hypothetical protein
MSNGKLIVNGWFVVSCVLALALILSVLICIEDAQAQVRQDTKSMVIRDGADGFNFDCTTEYPYINLRQMDWNSTDGLTEVDNYDLVERYIVVQEYNIINVYRDDATGDLFALSFACPERMQGNRFAIHIRALHWIEPR